MLPHITPLKKKIYVKICMYRRNAAMFVWHGPKFVYGS